MNAPEYLKTLRHWHLWRLEDGRKLPYQIDGRSMAKSNDPETWSTYHAATEALEGGLSDDGFRLAFTLGDCGLIGLDFDDCFQDDGTLLPWAEQTVNSIMPFAYVEHSPSGTGLKAICFGKKPDGVRSVFRQESGSKLEAFDRNRFWAWTGVKVVDNLPPCPAEMPRAATKSLRGLLFGMQAKHEHSTQPAGQGSSLGSDDAVKRASAYSDRMSVGPGERNNSLYHLTHKSRSFGCTEDQARGVVESWNATLADPLPHSELQSTFRSAWAGAPYKPAEDRPMDQVADMSGLTYEERKEAWERRNELERSKRQPVDYSDVIDGSGFVDLITGWALTKCDEQHPEYGLSAAITLLSLAAGRRYYMKMRHTTNGNTYIATIGHSGSGKESVRDTVSEFIEMAGLSEILPRCENVQGYKQLAHWVAMNPNSHFMLDEYAETMQKMTGRNASQHLASLAATLKSAYTQSGKPWNPSAAYGENGVGVINCPSVNINATMTPGGFESCISEQAVETGLLGRFSVFCSERRPAILEELPDTMPTSEQYLVSNTAAFEVASSRFFRMVGSSVGSITAAPSREQLEKDAGEIGRELESLGYFVGHDEMVASLLKIAKNQTDVVDRVRVEVMPDAELRLSEHFSSIAARNRDERGSIAKHVQTVVWTRAPEKTAKFALLFAVSRYLVGDSDEIRVELPDAERAIKLNNKLSRRLTALIEDSAASEHSKLVEKIVEFVDSCPGKTATMARITSFTKQSSPRDRTDAIKDAVASGLIEQTEDRKGYTTSF